MRTRVLKLNAASGLQTRWPEFRFVMMVAMFLMMILGLYPTLAADVEATWKF